MAQRTRDLVPKRFRCLFRISFYPRLNSYRIETETNLPPNLAMCLAPMFDASRSRIIFSPLSNQGNRIHRSGENWNFVWKEVRDRSRLLWPRSSSPFCLSPDKLGLFRFRMAAVNGDMNGLSLDLLSPLLKKNSYRVSSWTHVLLVSTGPPTRRIKEWNFIGYSYQSRFSFLERLPLIGGIKRFAIASG